MTDAETWVAFGKKYGLIPVKTHLRLSLEIAGIFALLTVGMCYRNSLGKEGAAGEALRELRAVSTRADKAAKLAIVDAEKSEAETKALRAKSNLADSVVRDAKQSRLATTRKYQQLRDSVLANEPSTLDSALVKAADFALENAEAEIHAHEAKEAIQDSVIATQSRTIASLHSALDSRQEQINALNKSVAIQARQISRSRWLGRVEGAGAAGFAAVWFVARSK